MLVLELLVADASRRHMRIHDPTYRLTFNQICHTCTKAFKHPKDLRRHELRHTKALLVCLFQGCGCRVGRWDNARRHLLTQHRITKELADNYLRAED